MTPQAQSSAQRGSHWAGQQRAHLLPLFSSERRGECPALSTSCFGFTGLAEVPLRPRPPWPESQQDQEHVCECPSCAQRAPPSGTSAFTAIGSAGAPDPCKWQRDGTATMPSGPPEPSTPALSPKRGRRVSPASRSHRHVSAAWVAANEVKKETQWFQAFKLLMTASARSRAPASTEAPVYRPRGCRRGPGWPRSPLTGGEDSCLQRAAG